MRHDDVRKRLHEYLDGEVSGRDKARIEAHLSTCRECSDALEDLRLLVQSLRRLGDVEPPSGMARSIMERIRAEAGHEKPAVRSSRGLFGSIRVRAALGAVAALFLVFTSIFLYRARITATGHSLDDSGKSGSVMGSPAQEPGGGPGETALEEEKPVSSGLSAKKEAAPRESGGPTAEAPSVEMRSAGSGLAAKEEAAPQAPAASAGGIAPPRILLRVEDVGKAAVEIRKLVEAGAGKVQSEEKVAEGTVIDVRLGQSELAQFKEKLAAFGSVEEAPTPQASSEGGAILTIEVELLKAGE
jgi:hypothetical protein